MYMKLFLLILVLWQKLGASGYNVAIVAHTYDKQIFSSLTPLQVANRNAKIYDDILKHLKDAYAYKMLDIAVFPEGTLVGEPLNTPEGRKAMTVVPHPDDNVIPCNSSLEDFSDFFKLLSCAARRGNTYLSINLKEKYKFFENEPSQGNFSWKFYNTNVVFDRNGKVVARYRKYNLYLPKDTDRPSEPDLITFDTDFNKTFGLFTCMDVLYKSPSLDLVRKGVENFIFPTLWFPELPFLTTLQVQQMWAQGNDVTLLSAGGRYPGYGYGTLAVFLGNQGPVFETISTRHDTQYVIGNVEERNEFKTYCSVEVDDEIAKNIDNYTLYVEDLKDYSYKKIDTTNSKIIDESICQQNGDRNFCCDFHIDTNVNSSRIINGSQVYQYFLVARNGLRSYGNNTYTNTIETCGLIACPGSIFQKCGQKFSDYNQVSWPLTFNKISIEASSPESNATLKFPNSLLADFSPIRPACTNWTTEKNEETSIVKHKFSIGMPVTKLLTFAIFGRNYGADE